MNIFLASVPYFTVLRIINIVIIIALIVFYFNQVFHMIASIFTKKVKYDDAKLNHNYGYLICARNEEHVINNLINSIKNQDYPSELMHIFVVADNCTDNTAKVAKDNGAIVFERNNQELIGKSYALDFAIKEILANYQDLNLEGLFIFDADNLVDPNFTKEINKAYDAGNKVITGYRASKNFGASWVAGGSSYMYSREARQIHHTRAAFNIGTYVSGTGYLIDISYLKDFNGWPFHTLVEDVEISTYLTSLGEKIKLCEKAIFYDEQPIKLKGMWRQRMRWCRGTHQVFVRRGKDLFKSLIKKPTLTKWGMFVHILPMPAIAFVWFIIYLIMGLCYYFISGIPFEVFYNECFYDCISNFVTPLGVAFICGLILMIEVWKENKASWIKKVWYMILFPFTMYLFFPITAITLFKDVKWKEIKHSTNIAIEDLNGETKK